MNNQAYIKSSKICYYKKIKYKYTYIRCTVTHNNTSKTLTHAKARVDRLVN